MTFPSLGFDYVHIIAMAFIAPRPWGVSIWLRINCQIRFNILQTFRSSCMHQCINLHSCIEGGHHLSIIFQRLRWHVHLVKSNVTTMIIYFIQRQINGTKCYSRDCVDSDYKKKVMLMNVHAIPSIVGSTVIAF